MAKFYKTELKEFKSDQDVLEDVYPYLVGDKYFPTMEERLGDAECVNCIEEGRTDKKETRWMLLPETHVCRIEGGKPYIQCLDCGSITHL